jgi:IS4 transposase
VRCQAVRHGRHKFRFRNKLLSIDSTMIDLCAQLFDWAKYQRTKGAVKLHLVLDHDGYLPSMMVITDGKAHDAVVARTLQFEPGTVLVMDRGYHDYAWFAELTRRGVFFVSRPRSNDCYRVLDSRPVRDGSNIVCDEIIECTSAYARKRRAPQLRRIELVREDNGEILTLLTNHMGFAASTVAAVYKDRWQIELFFKAIKQNLRIKTFVGTSANALKIQVWTALIAILIVRYLQLRSRFGWSLSNLVALLRMNLFTYRDLWAWLHKPFQTEVWQPPPQLELGF